MKISKMNEMLATAGSLDIPDNFEYSTEGFTVSLGDFLRGSKDMLRTAWRKLANLEVRFETEAPIGRGDLENVFHGHEWSDIRKFLCYTPSKMNGDLPEHVEVLTELLEEAIYVEKNLLDPLIKDVARFIAKPDDLMKVYVNRDIKPADVDRGLKRLKKTFDIEGVGSVTPNETTYGKVYDNKEDLFAQPERLKRLIEVARDVDLDDVIEKEKRLAGMIDDLVDTIEMSKQESHKYTDPKEQFEVDKQTGAKLARYIDAASRQMEYIAALMFYAKVNVTAFNESYEYSKRSLNRE